MNHRSSLWLFIVACVVFVLAVASACGLSNPTPSPTPQPPQPPQVLSRVPERGQEQNPTASIVIAFDQAMDHQSVEASFRISPTVQGSFAWEDNKLLFTPAAPGLERATTYHVSVDAARSAAGLSLPVPYSFDLRTIGYLEITGVQPADGTRDVAPDTLVTVMFNRPVVPLDAVGQVPVTSQILTSQSFAPPGVAGVGQWLNTSIYTFKPSAEHSFAPGTTYRLRIAAGLTDTTGGLLPQDYTWEFSTELPKVVSFASSDPEPYLGPSSAISVTFNMPMQHESVENKFILTPQGSARKIAGRFSWNDDKTLAFTPSEPLALKTTYVVHLEAGLQALAGGEGSAQEASWTFSTIEAPRITFTNPEQGEKHAAPYTSLQVTFSSPMNRDALMPNLTILPSATDVYTSWDDMDTQLYISFGAKPSTAYTFIFSNKMTGRYGQTLDKTYRLQFTTSPLSPALLMPSDRVATCNAYTTTAVYVQHVNVSELDLVLYRMERSDFILLNSADWYKRWEQYQPKARNLLRKWSTEVDSKLNAYLGTRVPLSKDRSTLSPGFYYLQISAPGVEEVWRQMLVVSHVNLVLKVAQQEALVWATDLSTGQAAAGLDVSVTGAGGAVLASGRTDKDGLLLGQWEPTSDPAEKDAWAPVLAIAGSDDDPAVASTDWSDSIAAWQFDLSFDPTQEPYRAYFYTDRSIYRPGQTVYFKGVLRSDDDGRYDLPGDVQSMPIVVTDNQGKEIFRSELSVNDMGTLHGSLTLDEEAGLGYYSLSAQLGARSFGTSFQVAEYRKPEFVVSVTTDKSEYVQGDAIQAAVTATYYFGGPVANATLQWRLMSQDYYFQGNGQGDYSFTDADYTSRNEQTAYGELVTSGEGTTDAQGRFVVQIPANIATYKNSQILTLEASITDASNQEVSGRNNAIVHKGLFYIGLQPQDYIGSVGRESRVNVITMDTKGLTVTQVPLTIVFLEERWYNVQQEADSGQFYWDWKLEEIPAYTTTVTTDAAGMAVAAFTPEQGGSYRVRALGRDARGNEVRSSAYLWISSSEYVTWRQENNDRIELVTDKKTYQPGETARILIPSPFQGEVQALLTIERGHILSQRLLTLKTNSTQVELPILPDYTPNVYVSVALVKGSGPRNTVAEFRLGYVNLSISTQEKELSIAITPDRNTSYQPGGKASFDVRATDYQGRGVQAEFSLQLVDLSVLALTNNMQGSLLDQFYRQRPLGVRTGTGLEISMERTLEQARPPTGKGGSGGSSANGPIRSQFPDTAYWDAEVRTDTQGQAHVTVDLPDNLTTWRMTGKAVTANTLMGEGQADIVATKDLLVRPVAPRFCVVGDALQLSAVVHNNTAKPASVTIVLEGQGINIEKSSQEIQVPAGGNQSVSWQAQVLTGTSAVLTWRATAGTLSDAVELTLPVYTYSAPQVLATSGQVASGESRTELLHLPERLDPSQGELTIQIDASLAASTGDGLKYLEEYPYECTEQTVSRFLPNVLTFRALQQLGMHNAELETRLPQLVGVGTQRLYALQHYDGGWGWWLSDNSDPFISAYVLLGLTQASKAGFAVDSKVMDRGADYLRGALDATSVQDALPPDTRAFVLYALAEHGQGDLGRSVALVEKRQTLSNYGKAYLALALQILESEAPEHTKTLLADLTSAAILSATGAHWEEAQVDYWNMNTNTRTTALVLDALVRCDPQNTLIPNAVRWLMVARKEGHWETTQETAWSLQALTDYMLASGELQADYDYQITLNAKQLQQSSVTTQDVAQSIKLVVAIRDLLRDESNSLVIERLAPTAQQTGKGQLYYSAYLRTYQPVEDVVAVNRGIIVSRQYTLQNDPRRSITTAQVGDVIQVKLTLIAPSDLHYLVLADPLPAGCEVLDTSLKTTSSATESPELSKTEQSTPYWWYFSQSELRDEKVALFATYLSRGTYEYTYFMRASIPGRFLTMPSVASEMYFPEVFGRGDGGAFTITP